MRKKIVIIGAGLSGLSLASELVTEGFEVEVVEKHQHLGGRARNTTDRKMDTPVPIGPHVLVAFYNNFFRFLKKIGAHKDISWERKRYIEIIRNGTHHTLRLHRLPAPLFTLPWIFGYPFIGFLDKISNIYLFIDIYFSSSRKVERLDGMTTYTYLKQKGVTELCINRFWRFIVLSLLNVPLEKCSAAEFVLLVQRMAHLKRRAFGFPIVGLGDLYTMQARAYIEERGGVIRSRTEITKIVLEGNTISHLETDEGEAVTGDIFVSTLNPIELRELFPEHLLSIDFFRTLNLFEPVPYISVNIWFDKKISHKQFWAMLGDYEKGSQYLNTDFYDLSNIYKDRSAPSYIASNIIYSEALEHLSDSEIIKKTVSELREVFPHMDAKVVHSHVHRIPYVVYAPLPNMRKQKLSNATPISNLFIAGDWTTHELPQCMEAAVRSGYRCAEAILKSQGVLKKICHEKVY